MHHGTFSEPTFLYGVIFYVQQRVKKKLRKSVFQIFPVGSNSAIGDCLFLWETVIPLLLEKPACRVKTFFPRAPRHLTESRKLNEHFIGTIFVIKIGISHHANEHTDKPYKKKTKKHISKKTFVTTWTTAVFYIIMPPLHTL